MVLMTQRIQIQILHIPKLYTLGIQSLIARIFNVCVCVCVCVCVVCVGVCVVCVGVGVVCV